MPPTLSASILWGIERGWNSRLDGDLNTCGTCFDSRKGPPMPDLDKMVAKFSVLNLPISTMSSLDLEVSDPAWAWADQWTSSTSNTRLCRLGWFPGVERFSWGWFHWSHTWEGMAQVVVCLVQRGSFGGWHYHRSNHQGCCCGLTSRRGCRCSFLHDSGRDCCIGIFWLGLYDHRLERGPFPKVSLLLPPR